MSEFHVHVHLDPQTSLGKADADEQFVAALSITFKIAGDDKEHQDAIAAQVIATSGVVVFDKEIVPPMGDNGNSDDPNAYYWPPDGPGFHPRTFVLGFSRPVPLSQFNGSRIAIRSYTDGKHSDFESWKANVDVQAIGSIGQQTVLLNGNASQLVNFQNDGSPGQYVYQMRLQ